MNWDAIGAVGEVLGAIAVIATIFYLARQVRETRSEIRSSAVTALNGLVNDSFLPIYNNQDNTRIWLSGLQHPDELSNQERELFFMFMHRLIAPIGTAYIQYLNGTLDKEAFAGYLALPRYFLSTPGGKAWLAEPTVKLNPEFMSILLNEREPWGTASG